jgi:hypothetical protein
MMKNNSGFSALILLFVFLISIFSFSIKPAKAQNSTIISNVVLKYEYGKNLHITANLDDFQNFSNGRLILQGEKQTLKQFELSSDGSRYLAVDVPLMTNPVIPFSRVYYWFEITDKSGGTITSPSYWFDYIDNRFQWNTNETNLFQISWVNGTNEYGQILQNIARDGLEKATGILPIAPQLPIKIYVYPDIASLEGAFALTSPGWAAGQATPEIGVVLVSMTDGNSTIELERQIPHELMHILEYQVAGDTNKNIPVWLTEGLATSAETYPNAEYQRVLSEAYKNGTLIQFSELCSGFPNDAVQAQLAYAQSSSLVKFIQETYGSQSFITLFGNSSSGMGCSEAVQKTFNVSLVQLQNNWDATTFGNASESTNLLNYVFYSLIGLVGVGIIVLIIRRRKSANNTDIAG